MAVIAERKVKPISHSTKTMAFLMSSFYISVPNNSGVVDQSYLLQLIPICNNKFITWVVFYISMLKPSVLTSSCPLPAFPFLYIQLVGSPVEALNFPNLLGCKLRLIDVSKNKLEIFAKFLKMFFVSIYFQNWQKYYYDNNKIPYTIKTGA